MDLGKLLRLKSVAEAAPTGAAQHYGSTDWVLSEAYGKIRAEAALAVPDHLKDEFDRLFPADADNDYARATSLLRQLAGWINGAIEEIILHQRIHAEAEAKARHVGFAPQ